MIGLTIHEKNMKCVIRWQINYLCLFFHFFRHSFRRCVHAYVLHQALKWSLILFVCMLEYHGLIDSRFTF